MKITVPENQVYSECTGYLCSSSWKPKKQEVHNAETPDKTSPIDGKPRQFGSGSNPLPEVPIRPHAWHSL